MSEKIYVRKVESWTISSASEPIEVVDDFDLVRDKVLEDTEWPELIEE
jgi:hypothetical protein